MALAPLQARAEWFRRRHTRCSKASTRPARARALLSDSETATEAAADERTASPFTTAETRGRYVTTRTRVDEVLEAGSRPSHGGSSAVYVAGASTALRRAARAQGARAAPHGGLERPTLPEGSRPSTAPKANSLPARAPSATRAASHARQRCARAPPPRRALQHDQFDNGSRVERVGAAESSRRKYNASSAQKN